MNVEELAKELAKIFEPNLYFGHMSKVYQLSYIALAKHVQNLIIVGKIDALTSCITPIHPDGYMMPIMIDQRITELQKQLAEV